MNELKKSIREAGLMQYRVAAHLGVSEFTLTRWLRDGVALPDDKKQQIRQAIKELIKIED